MWCWYTKRGIVPEETPLKHPKHIDAHKTRYKIMNSASLGIRYKTRKETPNKETKPGRASQKDREMGTQKYVN